MNRPCNHYVVEHYPDGRIVCLRCGALLRLKS